MFMNRAMAAKTLRKGKFSANKNSKIASKLQSKNSKNMKEDEDEDEEMEETGK